MKQQFVSLIIAAFTAVIMSSAFAANETSCSHGGACPSQGGNGGNGGNGTAVSGSVSSSTAIAGAISGASSKASANPVAVASGGDSAGGSAVASGNGGSASNGAVSNSVTTGNVRSLSLGAAAVGSPDAGSCVAYLAIGFGLVTSPVQLESCVAAQQAILLNSFGLRDAAIARLCQLSEIQETGICPPKAKKESVTTE
jgi:hypothetical protein